MSIIDNKFDAIIIGSGIGGLTTASLLAQLKNKRVLILERHFKLGGFTHTFSRKGKFEWDVGLHYVGQMKVGEPTRAMFDFITQGKVNWAAMPDVYDRFVYPDFTFDARKGGDNLKADLIAQFPLEKNAIEQYFKDMDKAAIWLGIHGFSLMLPRIIWPLLWLVRKFRAKLALMTTEQYLNSHFKDEKLKATLTSQWGLHGLPPNRSAFIGHILLAQHYAEGGYYPVGGSGVIAKSILPIVESHGGKGLINHTVDEIIIENGKAIGVRVTHAKGKERIKKEFYADLIISDAGARTTYTKLMPEGRRLKFEDAIRNFPDGVSNVTLYLGLKDDPAKLGLKGENYWIFSEYDHNKMFARRNELTQGKVEVIYVSFPSMKDPKAKGHTAEIIAFIDAEPFAKWKDQPWRKRGADYEALKEKISTALIEFAEDKLPGFEKLIEYKELATPITTEHFTSHHNGVIYGLPIVPEKFKASWLGPRTPIRNLFLTGSDAMIFGIVGAMMSGVMSTAMATRRPWTMMSMMTKAIQYSHKLHLQKGKTQ